MIARDVISFATAAIPTDGRYYGYILHESKGVSEEHCSMRMIKEQGEAYMKEMASKETKRRKRR